MASLRVDRWREPSGRHNHSTAVVGGDLYLWGGEQKGVLHESAEKRASLSNIEVFSVSTGCWKQCATSGTPPQGVKGYSCVAVGSELIYFGGGGGVGESGDYHNSINSLNTSNLQWRMVTPSTSEQGKPMRKSNCGMVYFNNGEEDLLYIMGGYGHAASPQRGAQYSKCYPFVLTNEQHIYSLSSNVWSSPEVTGQTALPCSHFTLTNDGKKAVMFGGWNGSSMVDDLFILDLEKNSVNWTKVVRSFFQPEFTWPDGRYAHSAVTINSSTFVLMGGIGSNDCWVCQLNESITHLYKLSLNDSVAGRQYYSMSALSIRPQSVSLLVFGGYPNIANTIIIELIKDKNDKWSMQGIVGKAMLSSCAKYQENLRIVMKKSTPAAGRRASDARQSKRAARGKDRQIQQLEQSMIMSQEAIQAVKRRVKEAEQCITTKELELQEAVLALEHSCQTAREKEIDNQQLLLQLDQSMAMSQEAIHAANRRTEEAHQRIREKEDENQYLKYQIQHLQEQLASEHWVVRRNEVKITDEELGRGGWGVVKVANFRGLRVAAKCLHQVLISQYNRRQFSREMTVAAKLRHPNLLLFIGATIEGEPVIITELMPTSLRKELEKGKLANDQIVTISRDVSCGLNYMHQSRPHPIIHRDISSGNVLLEPLPNGWRAKISDYGSANFNNQIASTIGPGSPAYAAPESRYPNDHTTKMDVFSLGVLMIEMCLGELPEFTASHRNAQIERILWPAMAKLIRWCISEQSADRPNAGDIILELEKM